MDQNTADAIKQQLLAITPPPTEDNGPRPNWKLSWALKGCYVIYSDDEIQVQNVDEGTIGVWTVPRRAVVHRQTGQTPIDQTVATYTRLQLMRSKW